MSKRSTARAAVKNARRARKNGPKRWMAGKPMMKAGSGGTDKTGSVKRSMVYYSDAPAEIIRGIPNRQWHK